MKRRTIGELIFWGAAAFALTLYWLTVPEGLPWSRLPESAHPLWRYFVAMCGGRAIVLSCLSAAVAGGLIGAMVNRYLGWRLGVAMAVVWVLMPGVWNRAIAGERGVCLAAAVVIAAWIVNAIGLRVLRKARNVAETNANGGASLAAHSEEKKRGKINRIAGWAALGAAALFAVASVTMHDYRYGEVASAYARQIVEEAGDRIILMNGVCDAQIEREAKGLKRTVSFRNTEDNRSNLVAWVRREWPGETNLWLKAQISPEVLAEDLVKAHPDRFFSMMGRSTTPENWAARWDAMKPFLDSRDPFVPAMRRLFAYEGNVQGNALQGKGELKAAWNLYLRIFTEVEPKNPAACVNLNEMLRRGYKVDDSTRQRIESAQEDYAKLLKDRKTAARTAARIASFGPVMRDQKEYEKLRERIRKRMEELKRQGKAPVAPIADLKTLEEWHPEMMKAFQAADFDKASRIARAILSRPAWRGFIPANMVLGEKMMMQDDWIAAEAFLRVAVEAKGAAAPPPMVLNDYAETLRRLQRFDEAEPFARKAVQQSDAKTGWLYRLTLAQILRDAGRNPDEMKVLVADAFKHAPKAARETIRREFPR